MKKVIHLINNSSLITTIEEVGSDIGEPDCKLTNPYIINFVDEIIVLEPWFCETTDQTVFMINSDKVLTIVEPSDHLLKKYETILKK